MDRSCYICWLFLLGTARQYSVQAVEAQCVHQPPRSGCYLEVDHILTFAQAVHLDLHQSGPIRSYKVPRTTQHSNGIELERFRPQQVGNELIAQQI